MARLEEQLEFAGLERQAELVATGEVSSATLVEASLQRAEALQPLLHPFRLILAEEARAAAAEADRRLAAGERAPLLGVPVAIKDDVDLAGQTTPFGCGGEHRVAEAESEVVRRLRAAGAVIVGKTMTPEVGLWPFSENPTFGAARNPWDPDHTPGGSSGGAAAAVAAGIVPGRDRLRRRGFGAHPGRVVRAGGPEAPARPHLHVARARVLQRAVRASGRSRARSATPRCCSTSRPATTPATSTGRPRRPSRSWPRRARDPGRLRIALSFATPLGVASKVDGQVRAAIERVARTLAELGHEIVRADPPYGLVGPALVPRGSAGVRVWCDERVPDRSVLEPRTRVASRVGRALGGPPLRIARRAERGLQRRIGRIFDRADVVLTPTTAFAAPRVGSLDGQGWWKTSTTVSALCPFAFAWNVLGWPALSVPAGHSASGLPVGAQLLGRECDEATLLALGAQLEARDGWPDRRPALS